MAEPSYSGLVFKTAWKNTIAFFKHLVRDIFVGIGSFVVGALPFIGLYGADALKEEFVRFLAFVFAPGGVFLLFVFLWNLCLASDELVYGEIRRVSNQLRDMPPSPQSGLIAVSTPVNWKVWRERTQYKIEEFAKILAQTNPVSPLTPEGASYQRLLIEEANRNALKAIPQSALSFEGRRYALGISSESQLAKTEAVSWAETKGFSVDHIK